jgi:hydroxyethylthiazole kinase
MNTPAVFDAYGLFERVRQKIPVVHHLTNWVTIYDCANIVKVFGASPVMAHAPEEVAEMTQLASALVLNIGTLTTDFIEAMKIAAASANKKGIPIVLDVCGAGATALRDAKSKELLDGARIDIIKGNYSEIARVAGEAVSTKGVDASAVTKDMSDVVVSLARARHCTVAATGAIDLVADEHHLYRVTNGDIMMSHIVGTGCMAASVIGTFAAVEKNYAYAAAAGLTCFEVAAECAALKSKGPGSFKELLYDCVWQLNREIIASRQKVEEA